MTEKPRAARPTGRPSIYSDEIAAVICERLANGETLRQICKDSALPDRVTVNRWLSDGAHKDFRIHHARAKRKLTCGPRR
jgi:hypothetical protein